MARNDREAGQAAQQLLAAFMKLPWTARVAIVVLLAAGGLVFALVYYYQKSTPTPPSANLPPGANAVVFCHWNLENLFDDRDDKRRYPDEEYDNWFVNDPAARQKKYARLTEALLKLNGGKGPDVLVGNEVESRRAAEMLKDSLNAALPEGAAKYEYVEMKELDAGRHIAPCVISRYPLSGARLLGRRQRILEVHVTVNSHDLTVIGSHWTSQLTDKGDDETRGRSAYANVIHDAYAGAIRANPKVDLLVCGDFNDTPDADSVVKHLYMTGDAKQVTADADPPKLLGLLSGKSPEEFGTHYYSKPLIYDHIGVSPGLLDPEGWGCDTASVRVPTDGLVRQGTKGRRPWRFGSRTDKTAGERGFSDHFPVVVTLTVAP